jgi:cell division protein FtsW (lipid II flippase)
MPTVPTDKRQRGLLRRHIIVYAVLVALALVSAALDPTDWNAWLYALTLLILCAMSLLGIKTAYLHGINAARADESRRSVTHWMGYVVDEDGLPDSPPMMGRMVLDAEPGHERG